MGEVTHEQANLLLRLYDLRREPRLREACAWMLNEFRADSMEELVELCPPGSREDASFRMVITFWDMCASLVNRGLIDEDLYFENVRDQCLVWHRIEPLIGGLREHLQNPKFLSNLERHVRSYEAWVVRRETPEEARGLRAYWDARLDDIASRR